MRQDGGLALRARMVARRYAPGWCPGATRQDGAPALRARMVPRRYAPAPRAVAAALRRPACCGLRALHLLLRGNSIGPRGAEELLAAVAELREVATLAPSSLLMSPPPHRCHRRCRCPCRRRRNPILASPTSFHPL